MKIFILALIFMPLAFANSSVVLEELLSIEKKIHHTKDLVRRTSKNRRNPRHLRRRRNQRRVKQLNKLNIKKYELKKRLVGNLKDSEDLGSFEYCKLPITTSDPLFNSFLTTKALYLDCPREIPMPKLLPNKKKAFLLKVRSILGKNLPEKMFKTRDPYFPLDYSKLPELDAIYISYLVFKADFYGAVIERVLRKQAERGAKIYILTTKKLADKKDKALLNKLDRDFKQVNLRYYKFKNYAAASIKELLLAPQHRSNHVKLFITQSNSNADLNQVFFGGRNIHEGFIFETPSDYKDYPFLHQYISDKKSSFSSWTSFEMRVADQKIVNQISQQYLNLFHQNNKTFLMNPYSLKFPVETREIKLSNRPLVRHMISVPYKDGHDLENLYIDLFRKSQKSIIISTPYFHITKKIKSSILNAIDRGVEITLYTRLSTGTGKKNSLLTDVARIDVNRFKDKFKIKIYKHNKNTLHTRLILIDEKLSLVGSVNLNHRSFYHDLENIVLIWSKEFYLNLLTVLEDYDQYTETLTKKSKIKFWKRIVIKLFKSEL